MRDFFVSAAVIVTVVAIAMTTVACTGFEAGRSVTPQSAAATTPTASGVASAPLVGTWGSQSTFTVPAASSCANFQWQITSQSATAASGTFSATCAGGVAISASASGVLTNATTVAVTVSGTALVSGSPACSFALTGTGTLSDNNNTLTIPYTGTTCAGPVQGTETLRRHVDPPPPPPPTPPPTPLPPPPTPPPTTGGDAIDLSQAIILNSPRDFASWTISTTITDVDIQAGGIHVEFSKRDGPNRWPDVYPPGWTEPLQYTLGMAENIGGRWYASAVVEFWYGLDRSGGPPSQYAANWFYDPNRWAPMTYHQPAVSEIIGLFVCEGDCRNNLAGSTSPLRERSNVVLVPMPTDGGSVQAFHVMNVSRPALPLSSRQR